MQRAGNRMSMKPVQLTEKIAIGEGHPCFVIAEAGVNHNGDLGMALEMVSVAAAAGADAIKFQSFKTENIITRVAPKAQYHIETTGDDQHQSWFDLLKTQELTDEMHVAIKRECEQRGILFMSTPYDTDSADLLDRLEVVAIKVASTDANNISFLEYLADKGRPIILSTAMSTMAEVAASVAAIHARGLQDLVIMQCTGNYPSVAADANLRAMQTMGERFNVPAGYSDHVPGSYAAVAAVAMGAHAYEKHFTLSRDLPGPDHRASLEPDELKDLVAAIRLAESMLGDGVKKVMPSEEKNRMLLRKNIVAARGVTPGRVLGADDIRVVRNGGRGLPADRYHEVLGRTARVALSGDQPIEEDVLVSGVSPHQ
jgi:sialic acid synthase SpsE